MAQHFDDDGVEAIIFTDIARDGMMQGVNIEATVKLAESVNIPVIASGGIKNLENVKKLAAKSASGVVGAITGRAIYEGTLDFAEGQKAADEISGQGSFGL
jgi:phosphoribosylformimino-5-aminoimidazole carboxamide ribotide isomerase